MKSNTITIKYKVPHLLAAIWNHRDCPKWLQNVIWDGINDRIDGTEITANYFASQLESARADEPNENELRYGFGGENVVPFNSEVAQ